jgi:hypothetical protein
VVVVLAKRFDLRVAAGGGGGGGGGGERITMSSSSISMPAGEKSMTGCCCWAWGRLNRATSAANRSSVPADGGYWAASVAKLLLIARRSSCRWKRRRSRRTAGD